MYVCVCFYVSIYLPIYVCVYECMRLCSCVCVLRRRLIVGFSRLVFFAQEYESEAVDAGDGLDLCPAVTRPLSRWAH